MIRKILVANDGSEGASKAFTAALELAAGLKACLHMISVEQLSLAPTTIGEVDEEKRAANHIFDQVIERARMRAHRMEVALECHIVVGDPIPTITRFAAQESFDLLVVGFHGHSALYRTLLGSTAEQLVETAPCAVLVVK
jgi:nucleotide-binding universal stress UspA family protein